MQLTKENVMYSNMRKIDTGNLVSRIVMCCNVPVLPSIYDLETAALMNLLYTLYLFVSGYKLTTLTNYSISQQYSEYLKHSSNTCLGLADTQSSVEHLLGTATRNTN